MAKVWFAKSGKNPTGNIKYQGQPVIQLDWKTAQKLLEVCLDNWCGDQQNIPKFAVDRTHSNFLGSDEDLASVKDPEHVIVEVNEKELDDKAWKPGFYRSRLSICDAKKRLNL